MAERGHLCRARTAVRLPGDWLQSIRRRSRPGRSSRRSVRAGRAVRVAGHRARSEGGIFFTASFLARRRRGGVVGESPDDRSPSPTRSASTRCSASSRPSFRSSRGASDDRSARRRQRHRAAREPRAAALPVGWARSRRSRSGRWRCCSRSSTPALFVESAGERMPALSQIGSVVSWAILAVWWYRTAAVVGVLPSLAVADGPDADHAGRPRMDAASERRTTSDGARSRSRERLLGLLGHAFLFFVALNREWSIPPGPLFGSLAVVTLATSVTAMVTRQWLLHVLGTSRPRSVVTGLDAAQPDGMRRRSSRRRRSPSTRWRGSRPARAPVALEAARRGAAAALFVGELTALVAWRCRALTRLALPFGLARLARRERRASCSTLTAQAGWRVGRHRRPRRRLARGRPVADRSTPARVAAAAGARGRALCGLHRLSR